MIAYLYEWIENIAFYLVIITVVLQVIPNNGYRKYIQFFTGLILIIMLAGPILKLFDIEESFRNFYSNTEYRQKVREIEEATKYLEGLTDETE